VPYTIRNILKSYEPNSSIFDGAPLMGKSVTACQDAGTAATTAGPAAAITFAEDCPEAAFFLLFAFPAGAFFTALGVFDLAAAFAEVPAVARLAALLALAQRAF
jgi:hypothetical protein